MATITVEITDSEFKALEHIAVDPAGWIKAFVLHRAFVATEDTCRNGGCLQDVHNCICLSK